MCLHHHLFYLGQGHVDLCLLLANPGVPTVRLQFSAGGASNDPLISFEPRPETEASDEPDDLLTAAHNGLTWAVDALDTGRSTITRRPSRMVETGRRVAGRIRFGS